jgi:hypothetical protein
MVEHQRERPRRMRMSSLTRRKPWRDCSPKEMELPRRGHHWVAGIAREEVEEECGRRRAGYLLA